MRSSETVPQDAHTKFVLVLRLQVNSYVHHTQTTTYYKKPAMAHDHYGLLKLDLHERERLD